MLNVINLHKDKKARYKNSSGFFLNKWFVELGFKAIYVNKFQQFHLHFSCKTLPSKPFRKEIIIYKNYEVIHIYFNTYSRRLLENTDIYTAAKMHNCKSTTVVIHTPTKRSVVFKSN